MRVKSLAIGDTLTAGVSSDDLAKPIRGCARTIAAAAEQLLLTHAHAAIARGFADLLDATARE
ncbi:hypothetical protein HFO91_03740 [Rhizobium leguminosarum]|uniref:hypothetical protein n=1 Tax=Rhizobium leguminosarum TaxID=384 RepID=UPI001C988E0A|nr:hypothetical protein [Rhizobium leguminosarum]MBY5366162.1 hypothetical protein [Rhizobium leguminosarum]MBY5448783.1 hypothetical protein [Rhizobium leguminosarum]